MESKKKQFFFKFPQLKKANKKAGVKQGKKLAHRRSISFPDLRNLPESTSMTSLASVASPGPGSSYHSDNDSIASGNIPGGEHLPPPDRAPYDAAPASRHPPPPARDHVDNRVASPAESWDHFDDSEFRRRMNSAGKWSFHSEPGRVPKATAAEQLAVPVPAAPSLL